MAVYAPSLVWNNFAGDLPALFDEPILNGGKMRYNKQCDVDHMYKVHTDGNGIYIYTFKLVSSEILEPDIHPIYV